MPGPQASSSKPQARRERHALTPASSTTCATSPLSTVGRVMVETAWQDYSTAVRTQPTAGHWSRRTDYLIAESRISRHPTSGRRQFWPKDSTILTSGFLEIIAKESSLAGRRVNRAYSMVLPPVIWQSQGANNSTIDLWEANSSRTNLSFRKRRDKHAGHHTLKVSNATGLPSAIIEISLAIEDDACQKTCHAISVT